MEAATKAPDKKRPDPAETGERLISGSAPPPNGSEPPAKPVEQAHTVVKRGAEAPAAESWVIGVFFAVVYGIVGYFMLTDGRIVSFDGLQQLNHGYMVWWNSPPKLSAIPLNHAPLGSVIYMPLTLIKPVATSLVALPVLTAGAAALLMVALNSTMRRCEVPAGFRYFLLVVFGLNPMFVFYAGTGDTEVVAMMLGGVALMSLVSWRLSSETRFLAVGGLALGVAALVDYDSFAWIIGLVFAFMLISGSRGHAQLHRRASLMVFLLPAAYAVMVWTLLNWLLLGNPFEWLSAQEGLIEVNTSGVLDAIPATWGSTFSNLAEVAVSVAPLGFATVLLLIVAGIVSRDGLSWGLLVVTFFAVVVLVARVMISDQAQYMDLEVGLPLAVMALVGAAWVYRSEESWRIGVGIVMAVGLIAAIPLGWNAMKDYPYQQQAQAFTRWVETGDSQEGTRSLGGFKVGIDPEVAMASYINESIPQDKSSILVDENFSYAPMILSGRPTLFFDRADKGEGEWESTLSDPFGKVNYMLITISRGGDQLRKRYPEAISGGELGMNPVFRTERYVLIQVSRSKPPAEQAALPGEVVPNRAPEPFTPQRPPDPADPEAVVIVPGTAPESAVTPTPAPAPTTGPGPNGGSTAPQIEGE